MEAIERFQQAMLRKERHRSQYILDTLLATVAALFVTALIYLFKLYPKIPNISLLYILIVLALASTRGRYPAIIASIIAFLSFDFFLVPPLFKFTISKLDEWLALFIFLVTAIITGQLAAALRRRAELATQREGETRVLYELVSATTSEEGLDRQLSIVSQAIVNVFSNEGVRDCAIFLPDKREKLVLQAGAYQAAKEIQLLPDEEKTAEAVMLQGHIVDLYDGSTLSQAGKNEAHRFKRVVTTKSPGRYYVRLIPLHVSRKVVGVVRLVIEDHSRCLSIERNVEEQERLNPQTAFFWTFLDQAAAVIERERLRRENLQVELLRRTDSLRSALLSSVSHDLRTPLSSIKAAASSLLQEDVQWDEETRRSFALAIERQTDRLNRLVGNLLDMSRIEGGALKPEKEWYPLDELIHDVLGHMQIALQSRDVRVSIPESLPPIELDYLQMDQVLTNLLENALRYTPPGTPIEIAVEKGDKEVMVSIADDGPGIPKVDQERIFDKFYRVMGTARRETSSMGTGLGLAVCRGLVEVHGGCIWAENRSSGGAVFRFTLPVTKVEG